MKKFSIEFKWAVIFSIALLLWMVFERSVGLHDAYIDVQLIYTNLFGIVAIVIYTLAIKDKKKHYYHGQMDWTKGFLSGAVVSILVACLNPLVQYISYTFISPDYFSNMIAFQIKSGHQTAEQAQKYFNMNYFLYKDALPALSMGVVTSAAVAWFVQTKPEKR